MQRALLAFLLRLYLVVHELKVLQLDRLHVDFLALLLRLHIDLDLRLRLGLHGILQIHLGGCGGGDVLVVVILGGEFCLRLNHSVNL